MNTEIRWNPEALKALGRLDLIAHEVLDGIRQGLHRSIRRGFSAEFFDYRNYEPSDDAAKIDWRLYARTGKFFIKRFEAETSLECTILLDVSNSMRWRWEKTVSKQEYGAILAASLGLLLVSQRDLVGLHTFGMTPNRHLSAKSSRTHIEEFFGMLASQGAPAESASELLETARAVDTLRTHKGLLILISDLEIPEMDLRRSISLLRARGDELIVFHLLDKAEIELPFHDATHLEDSETGEIIRFGDAYRKRRKEIAGAFQEKVNTICTENGALSIAIDTSWSPVEAILKMNDRRKGMF